MPTGGRVGISCTVSYLEISLADEAVMAPPTDLLPEPALCENLKPRPTTFPASKLLSKLPGPAPIFFSQPPLFHAQEGSNGWAKVPRS